MIFTRNPFPFLVTPHHPHGSSRLLDRGHLLDKPWTIPLTSQALASTMATAFRRLGWIPCKVRFGSSLGSFGIFRGCHWCHTHSCFLRGFLSAFPIAQPRSHLVEGGDPAWWPIRFLLDKCVWLLAVLLFFPQTKLLKAGLTLHDPQNFFPKHQGCLWAWISPAGRQRGYGRRRGPNTVQCLAGVPDRVEIKKGKMFSFTRIVFPPFTS